MPDPLSYRPKPGEIPTEPGVYRFRDKQRRVIYVGKAKNLRARLSSYFQDIGNLHQRTATMVATAASVEWTVVKTEVEALQLEYSWIKEFDPRFNVKYRDDKSYPWLAVTVGDEFPRVMVGRGAKRRGTRYFGPYSHAWAIRETVDILLRVFPMRSCSNGVFKRSQQIGRPCLLGYIDKCAAPCVGNVTADEHRAIVDDFCEFMAGRTKPFIKRIEQQMYAASEAEDYERAARLRDDLGAMQKALEKQAVVLGDGADADVIALAEDPLEVAVQVFYVRGGRIRGQRGWVADRTDESATPELVENFLLQLYAGEPEIGAEGDPGPGAAAGHSDLRAAARRPEGVEGGDPGAAARRQEGRSRRTSRATPKESLALHKTKRASDLTTRNQALAEIAERARARRGAAADRVLRRLPHPGHRDRRVDGGLRGRARPQERVPPVRDPRPGGLRRRRRDARGDHPPVPSAARRAGAQRGADGGGRPDARRPRHRSAAQVRLRPGLVVVDGGAPQVAAAQRALDELGIDDIPVCGLAKRLEEVWLPGEADPVILRRTSEGLYLLQRVRDEAHRFAIAHHRGRRSKSMVESVLDDVPGLGEVRRKTLLRHFGSLKKLREAEVDEIAAVPGIGPRTASAIKDGGRGGWGDSEPARTRKTTTS